MGGFGSQHRRQHIQDVGHPVPARFGGDLLRQGIKFLLGHFVSDDVKLEALAGVRLCAGGPAVAASSGCRAFSIQNVAQ